ncbi:MAG: DUF1080 domain-containing protein [Verrucomicrobiota bacterium]
MKRFLPSALGTLLIPAFAILGFGSATGEEKSEWMALFNGKDLEGWTPKIRYEKFGEDPKKTFRVVDGAIQVNYEHYNDAFKESFGHLFYETPFSHYRLRVEYRFTGEQIKDGPGWAFRNSGLMLHCQDPATMTVDQDFPASIEVQLLGGNGTDKRTTSNLCTPGTHVVIDDKLVKRHCVSSKSKTYHGDQWVTAEVEVRGNEVINHILDGEVVLSYKLPVLDEGDPTAQPRIKKQGTAALKSGFISLQSESHSVEFRKVELLPLNKSASLFDGKSFAGWEGDTEKSFRIEEGAIVGGNLKTKIPRNEFLTTTKSYGDFILRMKFKVLGEGANAGIQLRSRRIPDHHEMIGYQADLGDGWWGSLYDESRRRRVLAKADPETIARILKRDDWNDYEMHCEGRRVRLKINGVQTVDFTEPDESLEQEGLVGLQIHSGPPSEAWYKDITIEEL